MKKFLPILLVVTFLVDANEITFSQTPKIYKAYAFSKAIVRGIMPADSNELKNDTEYFFYIELPKKINPSITYALVKKKIYTLTISDLDTASIIVVTNRSKEKGYTIKPKKNNKLWFLKSNLSEEEKTVPAKYKKLPADTVLLQLIYKAHISYYVISPIISIKFDRRTIL